MRKLKIAHCLEKVHSGGVEQRRLSLVSLLDHSLYEHIIICTTALGGLPNKLKKIDCPIYEIGEFQHPLDSERFLYATKILKDFSPDIVHGAVFEGVSVAALSGRCARVPLIIGEETSDPVNRRWRGHLYYRLLSALTHHMVAVSSATYNYLTRKIYLPKNKVSLINNGVIEPPPTNAIYLNSLRKSLNFPPDAFVIGTVGRLVDKHKRVSDLIRALSILDKGDYSNIFLLIVGAGPDEPFLRKLSKDLLIDEKVRFVGYQAETRPYYDLMDVFTLASEFEAFGLVLVEAMFASLPIVATCVGGIPTIVDNGETGILVEPGNPSDIARNFIALYNNPSRRKIMGEKGRRRALKEFSAERYVSDVDQLYQDLARNKLRG